MQDIHKNQEPKYKMNVTGLFHGDPMMRQITEAVQIRRTNSNNLNSKQEYRQYHIPQINITT